jgi:hypothetical protein
VLVYSDYWSCQWLVTVHYFHSEHVRDVDRVDMNIGPTIMITESGNDMVDHCDAGAGY